MPISYSIDPANHLVRIVGSGTVTDEELTTCVGQLYADPEMRPDLNTLSDMRGVEVAFTGAGVAAMRGLLLESPRRGAKIATLVDSEVGFGMGRMTQMRLEGLDLEYRIFRDMDPALSWLGLGALATKPGDEPSA